MLRGRVIGRCDECVGINVLFDDKPDEALDEAKRCLLVWAFGKHGKAIALRYGGVGHLKQGGADGVERFCSLEDGRLVDGEEEDEDEEVENRFGWVPEL